MVDLDTTQTLASALDAAHTRLRQSNLEAMLVITFDDRVGGEQEIATNFYGSEDHLLLALDSVYRIAPHLFSVFALRMMQDKLEAGPKTAETESVPSALH